MVCFSECLRVMGPLLARSFTLVRPGWIVHDSGRKRDYVGIKRKLVSPALPFKSEMRFLPCSGTFDASNIHVACTPPSYAFLFSAVCRFFTCIFCHPRCAIIFRSTFFFTSIRFSLDRMPPENYFLIFILSSMILLNRVYCSEY